MSRDPALRITIFTLFPGYFVGPLSTSLLGKAVDAGRIDVETVDFRAWAQDRHRTVDDTPYGGGPGMILKPDPIVRAFEARPPRAEPARRIYLTPWGRPLDQARVRELAGLGEIQLLCGRYEGVDERVVDGWIDEALSVGDFVLAGGEAAALCLVEAVARYVPGVLGEPRSVDRESFSEGLLEGPQYTRPAEFRGRDVPEILRSGDHGRIEAWRREQALARTRRWRPDLLDDAGRQEPHER